MNIVKRIAALALVLVLSACMPALGSFPQPKVTKIEVMKEERELVLLSHGFPVRRYPIDLGDNPVGPKRQRGDGKTPEGEYFITHLNTRSAFTLSLGISYPSQADAALAKANGIDPGDDIFIHGLPNGYGSAVPDWTNGCIAVSNDAIKEMATLVKPGTPIVIHP